MKGLGMVTDFYIGGSTNIGDPTTEFGFADYLQDFTGIDYIDQDQLFIWIVKHRFCSYSNNEKYIENYVINKL